MASPLLSLNGVDVRRGMSVVLRSHSLQVEGGELVALVGANGAGKSTLLETAAGLLPIESGAVLHQDTVVIDAEGRRRTGATTLGLVLQKNGMLGSEVVDEHLKLACSTSGNMVDMGPFLEAFNLKHRTKDMVAHLSQGQARKVAVLAGLLPAFASQQPALVLLDEPASGLDDDAVVTLCGWLAQLREAGHALVVCTHDERIRQQATRLHDVSAKDEVVNIPPPAEGYEGVGMTPARHVSRTGFGLRVHWRTLLWLNTNGMAALLTLGVLLSLGELMSNLDSMQRLGLVLAPALAAGLCGEPLVAVMREERAAAWWRGAIGGVPHAGALPLAIGFAITACSMVGLQESLNLTTALVGSALCWSVWHAVRLAQLSTERLARPHAVLIGLLTPVLVLPYALLIDWMTR